MTRTAPESFRVLIVDERRMFGPGLRTLFGSAPAVESAEWISDPCTTEIAVGAGHPDVVLVSMAMHRRPPEEVISRVRGLPRPPAVVALVDNVDALGVRHAVSAGATGVVSLKDSTEDLLEAVTVARRGVARLPAEVVGALVESLPSRSGDRPPLSGLTRREREVLGMLVAGLDRRTIAASLYCSPETVRTHIRSVLRKLGAHSTLEAVHLAVQLGVHDD